MFKLNHSTSRSPSSTSGFHRQSFHVDSTYYDIIFVNNNTSTDMLNKLLMHVNICKQYSIDTESERRNNQLALIQINTIPIKSKSLIILFELNQFPDRNSRRYEHIHNLFRVIFREGNEIYSWGDMKVELQQAKELLTWPITAELINIQPHFSWWYSWARSQCGEEDLSCRNDMKNDSCSCHPPSPYKVNELWSLQKAFLYVFNLFIDKTYQRGNWSSSLSSSHSSLSHEQQQKMIHYATHDAMAVTFLIRPVTENWPFNKIKNRMMNEIFISFNKIKMPPPPATTTSRKIKNINIQKLASIFKGTDSDLEPISSDEEIHLNQLIQPITNDIDPPFADGHNYIAPPLANGIIELDMDIIEPINISIDELIEPTNENLIDISDDELNGSNIATVPRRETQGTVDSAQLVPDPTEQQQQQRRKKIRSAEAKKKHNKKRNDHLRLFRYQNVLKRSYYYRFRLKLIRKIIRYYGVSFRHVKFQGDEVVIGVKSDQSRRQYEDILPAYCFDKKNYWRFKK